MYFSLRAFREQKSARKRGNMSDDFDFFYEFGDEFEVDRRDVVGIDGAVVCTCPTKEIADFLAMVLTEFAAAAEDDDEDV